MNLPRRNLLRMTASAVALSALPGLASALDYPTRPVHVVVGFPAGTTLDIIARLVCEPLSQRLGQRFIVDDRPGAATNIATETVARAVADGYTLLVASVASSPSQRLPNARRFSGISSAMCPGRDFQSAGNGAITWSRRPTELVGHAKIVCCWVD